MLSGVGTGIGSRQEAEQGSGGLLETATLAAGVCCSNLLDGLTSTCQLGTYYVQLSVHREECYGGEDRANGGPGVA